ncbi:hypothetical protein ACFONL_13600 [Camelimonas fluminis]|uniref:Uncharacterized protein n=1 Tax=Camelimonas fluminis TaxID=1576911 RepID=A0ABV7UIJ1_9HYPH
MSNDDIAAALWDRFIAKRRRADMTLDPADEVSARVAFGKWEHAFVGPDQRVTIPPNTNVIPFPVRPRP